jgi:hypothetical protein
MAAATESNWPTFLKSCSRFSTVALRPCYWCPRGDSNSHILTDNRFSYHFGFRRPVKGSWSGLSLHRRPMPLGAARLVSTPSRFRAWLGISSEAFPEFEQFYSRRFHRGTQVFGLSLSRLPIPPQGHMSAYSVGAPPRQRKIKNRAVGLRRHVVAGFRSLRSLDSDPPSRVFRSVRIGLFCPPSRARRSLRIAPLRTLIADASSIVLIWEA